MRGSYCCIGALSVTPTLGADADRNIDVKISMGPPRACAARAVGRCAAAASRVPDRLHTEVAVLADLHSVALRLPGINTQCIIPKMPEPTVYSMHDAYSAIHQTDQSATELSWKRLDEICISSDVALRGQSCCMSVSR